MLTVSKHSDRHDALSTMLKRMAKTRMREGYILCVLFHRRWRACGYIFITVTVAYMLFMLGLIFMGGILGFLLACYCGIMTCEGDDKGKLGMHVTCCVVSKVVGVSGGVAECWCRSGNGRKVSIVLLLEGYYGICQLGACIQVRP